MQAVKFAPIFFVHLVRLGSALSAFDAVLKKHNICYFQCLLFSLNLHQVLILERNLKGYHYGNTRPFEPWRKREYHGKCK